MSNIERSKVCRPEGYGIQTNQTDDGEVWLDGCAITPQGIVRVYSENRLTVLRIVINGYEYCQRIDRGFTARGLVTAAARFAASVVKDTP